MEAKKKFKSIVCLLLVVFGTFVFLYTTKETALASATTNFTLEIRPVPKETIMYMNEYPLESISAKRQYILKKGGLTGRLEKLFGRKMS